MASDGDARGIFQVEPLRCCPHVEKAVNEIAPSIADAMSLFADMGCCAVVEGSRCGLEKNPWVCLQVCGWHVHVPASCNLLLFGVLVMTLS